MNCIANLSPSPPKKVVKSVKTEEDPRWLMAMK